MEDNKDIQIQVKTIPSFTVLKNGSILKNIFLLRKHSAVDGSSRIQESDEQILLVGRHPHCHITLGHPSISRYHLRIHSNPSLHLISVEDLSSVHGTWVSGRRIEPGAHVVLKEGDTVKMGGSSRVYELHWVPLSQANNADEQFVPTVCTIKEGEEEESNQVDDEKHDAYLSDNDLEGSDMPLSDEMLNPTTSSVTLEDSSPLKTGNGIGEPLTTVSIQALLVASEAISESKITECPNKSEDKLNSLWDNLSNESDQISHGTIEDDLVSIDRSNAIETHERGDLNQYIERSNETDLNNENEPGNQQKVNNGSVPVVLFDGVNRDVGCEFEQIDQTKMMDESASVVLLDGVDMAVKSGSVDYEMKDESASAVLFDGVHIGVKSELVDYEMKDESVYLLPDVTTLDQEKTLTPDISMNLLSVQNVSTSVKLIDSLVGKELELYTPDKENKNPNACSGRSLSKKAANRDAGCEFEQVDQTKMMNESASVVHFEGVGRGVKPESLDHEMKDESVLVLPDVTDLDQEKTSTPDISMNLLSVENVSASIKLFDSLDGKELEFYTPDKENRNPNACSGKSLSKKAVNSIVSKENNIFGFSQILLAADEGMDSEHKVVPFVNCEEVLASSEKENTSRKMIMEGSCNSINCPQTVKKAFISSQTPAKKRWTMVLDTNSLLDHNSLKHLKLLEGIKGTRLFVPKSVVNELMDIKSQDNFFKRSSKKVSLALKWIDECMMNTRWWIHEDDEVVHSSTGVPEVLEIALHLRKGIADQNIIILSNNHTMKFKAMAEGIMCEAAEEFHKSLVNPFSERFMWVGSSARGLTWSCVEDDDIVRQKYHGSSFNGSHRFKGLKLLAHVNHVTVN